mmetsp:Transcript_148595/g.477075  ORF Transcript_148595/g.477075 Transcript_148595/m.477075 type:complete len:242 (+) Transcript_148595:55-780(+)
MATQQRGGTSARRSREHQGVPSPAAPAAAPPVPISAPLSASASSVLISAPAASSVATSAVAAATFGAPPLAAAPLSLPAPALLSHGAAAFPAPPLLADGAAPSLGALGLWHLRRPFSIWLGSPAATAAEGHRNVRVANRLQQGAPAPKIRTTTGLRKGSLQRGAPGIGEGLGLRSKPAGQSLIDAVRLNDRRQQLRKLRELIRRECKPVLSISLPANLNPKIKYFRQRRMASSQRQQALCQ